MGIYNGTSSHETITPWFVSSSVTRDPPDSFPSAADDSLAGGGGDDNLNSGNGNDTLFGGSGNDTLNGYKGNDTLDGGSGDDELIGGGGNNTLIGGENNDELYGWNGNNTLYGGDGSDTLIGGVGNNTLYGGNGNDRLHGGFGNETLDGGNNHDTLYGEDGTDKLIGGGGNDTLHGGNGKDTLTGGTGADKFDFNATAESPAFSLGMGLLGDVITDFSHAQGDRIDLSTIDAKAAFPFFGNQAFVFLGQFSGPLLPILNIGQVYARDFGSTVVVQGNNDADAAVDLEITLTNFTGVLVSADFIL